MDVDAPKPVEIGYTQNMQRKFSVLYLFGVAFSLPNSWCSISASLITDIIRGDAVVTVYEVAWIAFVSICVGITLSELASAMPNAESPYFWVSELTPQRYASFVSYLTGWCAWAAAILACASVASSLSSAVVAMWQLGHPDFVQLPWHSVVAYEIINFFAFLLNCVGQVVPKVATTTLYISLISFAVILITVPTVPPPASTHETTKFVFPNFGHSVWPASGMYFVVGLINLDGIFTSLDSIMHPSTWSGESTFRTVLISFFTTWFHCMAETGNTVISRTDGETWRGRAARHEVVLVGVWLS